MKYEAIGRPFELTIDIPNFGLNGLGSLNKSVHALMNHVCISMYDEQNKKNAANGKAKVLEMIPYDFNREEVLVKAEIVGIRKGSILFDLQAVLAQVASEPGASAIAINLISNVIWSILHFSGKIVNSYPQLSITGHCNSEAKRNIPSTTAKRQVRPRVEKIIKALAQTENGGKVEIRNGEEYVLIEINETTKN